MMTDSISGKVTEIRRDLISLRFGAITLKLKVNRNLLAGISVGDTVDILSTDDSGVVQKVTVATGVKKGPPSPSIIGRVATDLRKTE
jgi:hypothetical protein